MRLCFTKGGIMSESTENLQIARISIPKHYPKLLYPVHENEKNVNFLDFTGLICRKVASSNASRFVTRLAYMHSQNDNILISSPS